jgi:hypothetical protein
VLAGSENAQRDRANFVLTQLAFWLLAAIRVQAILPPKFPDRVIGKSGDGMRNQARACLKDATT